VDIASECHSWHGWLWKLQGVGDICDGDVGFAGGEDGGINGGDGGGCLLTEGVYGGLD